VVNPAFRDTSPPKGLHSHVRAFRGAMRAYGARGPLPRLDGASRAWSVATMGKTPSLPSRWRPGWSEGEEREGKDSKARGCDSSSIFFVGGFRKWSPPHIADGPADGKSRRSKGRAKNGVPGAGRARAICLSCHEIGALSREKHFHWRDRPADGEGWVVGPGRGMAANRCGYDDCGSNAQGEGGSVTKDTIAGLITG